MKTLNILQATLFSLTPMKIAYNTNVYTFNKNLGQTYIDSNNSSQEYGRYSFNDADTYQILNNTVQVKNTVIEQMEIDNSRQDITCKAVLFNQVDNNGNKFEIDFNIINSFNNTNNTNMTHFEYGVLFKNSQTGNTDYTALNSLVENRYTNAYSIRDQISGIYNRALTAGLDENLIELDSVNYPNDFLQNVNSYLTDFNNRYADTTGNEYKEAVLIYYEMKFSFTGTYQNLEQQTKEAYWQTYLNLSSQVNYTAKTEIAPIVVNGDIVDIPNILFTIIGMPFAWFSTAFNLTLFPNTPYSINIATLLLGVIGLLIAIFIIRKLIK